MNIERIRDIQSGLETAYINGNLASNLEYKPGFVSNNPTEGKKVISSIEDELLRCESFQISVAFITMGGITPLLQTLQELEKRQIPGEILTTNYLNFSEPKALEKLNSLKNITLRMYDVESADNGFHTKGYIFRKDEVYRIILGSSNMTKNALTRNVEWNLRIISTEQGEVADEILEEYKNLWDSPYTMDFDSFYEIYKQRYEIIQHQREIARKEAFPSFEKFTLKPNSMQEEFIVNLRKIIEQGEERALLISATGTGKTYASAFAMRELGFKRVLFLVHRAQLACQAMDSYQKVFDESITMGMVGAGKHEYDADYIFAMVETLNRDQHLFQFAPDAFDCIILDEAHHSPANTYQKVMDYFQPKLFLGMTATPDKRDDNQDGRNVYQLFHYQIALEIRLQRAMEDNLLCPFHYFGINDITLDEDKREDRCTQGTGSEPAYEVRNNDSSEVTFSQLTSDERVNHVISQAEYFGYSGSRVKGLIFCSRNKECQELSRKFNERGYRTLALSGSDSEQTRARAFERLAMEEEDSSTEMQPLDYIFSVDILNEGVDIVEVNQVIMLRPTESPIVFIQQLGRGLRKAYGKEYVVILDFIGNYKNNFMIPVALSGDRTYNKDNVRRYMTEGNRIIPGASTIHFDEISRKKIYASIDNANFSDIKLIKESYNNLKNKLGRIPELKDFDRYGEMDVLRIFDNKSLGSYYKFLSKYEKAYPIHLNEKEERMIQFVSTKLASGKRVEELILLRECILHERNVIGWFAEAMEEIHGSLPTPDKMQNIINILTNEFPSGAGKKTYADCVFLQAEDYLLGQEPKTQLNESISRDSRQRMARYAAKLLGKQREYRTSLAFKEMLLNPEFKQMLMELIEFGISRNQRDYSKYYQDTDFVLYQKYTYEDACRLLNWEHNEVPLNIGGYKFDKKTRTLPVFINYDKGDDVVDTQRYEDHFLSPNKLIHISKSGRSVESEDVQNFLHARERNIDVQLFVRKNKDDKISKEFYYLGRMQATGMSKEFILQNTEKSAVEIEWMLDTPVREDIYEYLIRG